MNVKIIRVNGSTEEHEVSLKGSIHAIQCLIDCSCCDSVNLRNGMVMMVDDTGMIDGKPVNPEATKLYHGICKPGTKHQICGDVAIVRDADFA